MANWLFKSDPDTYSFDDLHRDGKTVWDGVSNPVAVKNLRGMMPGDKLIIYETGDHKSAVGTATVVSVDASGGRCRRTRAGLVRCDAPHKFVAHRRGRGAGIRA